MKLKNIILLGVATAALTACDDLFEPALENNMDYSQMYVDPQIARGIMENAWLYLGFEENPTNMLDLATDNAVSNDINSNLKKMTDGVYWTSQQNPINQWENRYHAIQYLNLFLEAADDVAWDYSTESLNEMHKDNYKGNAYAFRGLHLFYLLRAHCGLVNGELMGVPIHLVAEDGSSDFNLPRNTFKECIDQIMADFDEALKYLPEQYGNAASENNVPAKYKEMGGTKSEYDRAFGNTQRGKIDGRMIAAFKAQVALFAASPAYASAGAATYEQAAQYAAASLRNVGGIAGLDPEGWRWYCDVDMITAFKFDGADPQEICWRGVVDDRSNYESDNYPPSLDGNGRVNPTQNLVDAFPMANGYPITASASGYDANNPYDNRDPRLKEYILVNGEAQGAGNTPINMQADDEGLDGINRENGKSTVTGYYLRKLLRSDINLNPVTNMRHFGARIRYTEIFLDYAEAANEARGPKENVGGANFSAYDVIKAIRKRAGVGGANDPYLEECAQSKEKMRELIRNERRLELCFENHRFWDLRRWNANLNETARGVKITTVNGVQKYEYFDVEARKYADYMYYGPIPYAEVVKWSNLLQNDGWR